MRPLKVAEKSARTRNHTLLKEISYDQYKLVRRFLSLKSKTAIVQV